jgi:hypothetical protein
VEFSLEPRRGSAMLGVGSIGIASKTAESQRIIPNCRQKTRSWSNYSNAVTVHGRYWWKNEPTSFSVLQIITGIFEILLSFVFNKACSLNSSVLYLPPGFIVRKGQKKRKTREDEETKRENKGKKKKAEAKSITRKEKYISLSVWLYDKETGRDQRRSDPS